MNRRSFITSALQSLALVGALKLGLTSEDILLNLNTWTLNLETGYVVISFNSNGQTMTYTGYITVPDPIKYALGEKGSVTYDAENDILTDSLSRTFVKIEPGVFDLC